uniref:Uncharacterized protein n=1 Tax=Fagus sylvatica TaxID=28930 RepID=A0A2N9G5J9_FAGSY
MMWRSKDHRSAGLWWSLLSSGGSLGGHGRLLKSFQSLIIHFCSSWCCRGLLCDEVHRDQWTKEMTSLSFHHFLFQLVLIWAAMVDLLVFSAITSSSSSSAAAGAAAADHFVTEFAVDRWVIHRGPLGGVEDQPPFSFLGFG